MFHCILRPWIFVSVRVDVGVSVTLAIAASDIVGCSGSDEGDGGCVG